LAKQLENDRRQRIVTAAFSVLMERGYAGASTLEIARRARVSKRELYAEFGTKTGILEALISETATRMQVPLSTLNLTTTQDIAAALAEYGKRALAELTSPHVVAINRLAAAEAGLFSDLGKILDQRGREPNRRALIALMAKAQAARLLAAEDPDVIAGQFFALLTGDLLQRLMIGVIKPPTAKEIERRARIATEAVMRLHAA
jgi:AcrR family transcriptional regulator